MSAIKTLDDLQNLETYKKDLAKSAAAVGKAPQPVLFVKKFAFSNKIAPLVLVGKVDPALLKILKETHKTT